MRETIGSGTNAKVLDFIYDESGKPFALSYTVGTATTDTYYYVLNLQGDVVGLVNSSGGWVAQYTYNAWGEIITSSGTMAEINPLRYRGYYYDTETGFYYLQSRYYDPVTHRFINADSLASTGQGILGHNMFAYCNNNPVMFSDHTGHILQPFCVALKDGGEYDATGDVATEDDKDNTLWTALFESLECNIGIGMGYYGQKSFALDAISAAAGVKGNIAQFNLDDGKIYFSNGMTVECSVSLYNIFDFGYCQDSETKADGTSTETTFWPFNNDRQTISLVGGAAYFVVGGSIDISFNVVEFFDRLQNN